MSAALRVMVFAWWAFLESITVYAMAYGTAQKFNLQPGLEDWLMAAILGTMIASMFCVASLAFLYWVITGKDFI